MSRRHDEDPDDIFSCDPSSFAGGNYYESDSSPSDVFEESSNYAVGIPSICYAPITLDDDSKFSLQKLPEGSYQVYSSREILYDRLGEAQPYKTLTKEQVLSIVDNSAIEVDPPVDKVPIEWAPVDIIRIE